MPLRSGQAAPLAGRLVLLLAIVLAALNLRPFITGIGPLASDISRQTGLGLQGLSLLTLVPILLMGAMAFAGPGLQARLGARRAIMAALAVLALGSLLRLYTATGWQLVATAALLGLGAAVLQAMFPGVIKRHFPDHVGVVMGLYSAMLMGGGAVGAQLAPRIGQMAGDWHVGLAWMAVPALLALWLCACSLPADQGASLGSRKLGAFLRRPRSWLLMVCFGLANGGYSTAVAWLSPFYQDFGWSAAASGGLLAVMALCQAAAALLLPVLARRHQDRRPWLWLTLALQAIGFAALVLWPLAAPYLWVGLLGAGLGGCFALSMIVALDHLPDPVEAGTLAAVMQGGGFLLSALPPWIVAVLHERTGGFAAGWLLHLGCALLVAGLYWRMAPAGYASAMQPNSKTPDA